MMLKTSSNKVNPFCSMFKNTFLKNIGIMILGIIGLLLICPSYTYISLGNVDASFRKEVIKGWTQGFPVFCAAVSSIAVIGMNLLNFSFMYKRPSSDFTDSLPLTRTELFFSRSLSGLLISLLPTVVSLSAFGIFLSVYGYSQFIKSLLISFIYIAVLTVLTSAFSMVFIVSSASIFDFLLSFFTVNAGFLVLGAVVMNMLEELLVGYANNMEYQILKCVSPFVFSFGGFAEYIYSTDFQDSIAVFFIKCAVLIIAFGLFALLLYKKRKTESSGKAFAYKYLYYICAVTVSICGAYVFGEIFSEGDSLSPLFYVFAVIGALLTAVIYGAITFRGFKTVKSSLTLGALSVVLIIAAMITIRFDFLGFNKRIPKENEIKTVDVEYIGNVAVYENPEFALKLHKKLINDETGKYLITDKNYGDDAQTVSLKYTLKNGKQLSRVYWMHVDNLKSELKTMLSSDERMEFIENYFKSANLKTLEFSAYEEKPDGEIVEDISSSYITYAEWLNIVKAYKADIKANGISDDVLHGNSCSYISIWGGVGSHSRNLHISLDEKYTETSNYIHSLNLSERVAQAQEE